MRQLAAALLVLVGSSLLAAQSPAAAVRSLDSAWARAYAVHDTALARSLFANDIVITSGAGALKTREQELGDVRPSPGLVMHYFRTQDVDVHVYADNAVVVGNAVWEFELGGQTRTLRRRYTTRYRRGGPLGWQMVELHLFPVPATAGTPR